MTAARACLVVLVLAACSRTGAPGAADPRTDPTGSDVPADDAGDVAAPPDEASTDPVKPDPLPDAPRPDGYRNWELAPAIIEMDAPAHLWVVGDVHGDWERLRGLLANAGVAAWTESPSTARWLAGEAVLVLVGDLIDKWDRGLDVIRWVRALASDAETRGGRVIVLMGNHEANFLAWPSNDLVKDFAAELEAAGLDPLAVARGEAEPGPWLRSLPLAARVGEFFFIHAGNTKGRTTDELRHQIEAGVDLGGYGAPVLTAPDSFLETPLQPTPWWELPGYDGETVLAQWAAAVGAGRIVQGHDPGHVKFSDGKERHDGEMYVRLGRVFLVDTGMSRGIDHGPGAALHVERSPEGTLTATAVRADGTTELLWESEGAAL